MRFPVVAVVGVALVMATATWGGGASSRASAGFTSTTPSATLPVYPLDFEQGLDDFLLAGESRIAADGAFEVNYRRQYDHAGWQFQPVAHAKMCTLAYGELARTGDEADRAMLLRSASALIGRAERDNGKMLWRYGFRSQTFGAEKGWISGMAQGLAMACFAGAHLASGDRSYLQATREAFAGLRAPFGNHGTATKFGGGVFFEEVAGAGARPAHILNGHIFALAGVWLASVADDRREYRAALTEGARAVRNTIRRYETAGISLYDLGPRTLAALGYYNAIHIAQLQWLFEVTSDEQFLAAAIRFARFERRIDFTVEENGVPWTRAAVASVTTGLRSWVGPLDKATDLTLKLGKAGRITEVGFVAPEGKVPTSIELDIGGIRRRIEPDGRFFSIRFPAVEARSARLHIVPVSGGKAGLTLLTFLGDETRGLAGLSSDLSAYRQSYDVRRPLNLFDGNPSTAWSSVHANSALLIDLGRVRAKRLILSACEETTSPSEVVVGTDLRNLVSSGPQSGFEVNVPKGRRYVILRWARGGCLTDVTAA